MRKKPIPIYKEFTESSERYLSERDDIRPMKTIEVKQVSDELFFKLVEQKGKMQAETWNDFLEKAVMQLSKLEKEGKLKKKKG